MEDSILNYLSIIESELNKEIIHDISFSDKNKKIVISRRDETIGELFLEGSPIEKLVFAKDVNYVLTEQMKSVLMTIATKIRHLEIKIV